MPNYPLVHVEVWDYTKMEALLDKNYQLQKAFPNLTYTSEFFKSIVERVSSAAFWDRVEQLFAVEVDADGIIFESHQTYDSMKDRLWSLYDALSLVESSLSTITNYIYTWPEFRRMVEIAVQNPDYSITLGENHRIEHGGGQLGSSRTIWHVMRRLVKNIDRNSNLAHEALLFIAESNRTVARTIARKATEYYEASSFFTFSSSPDFHVTPLQFSRYKTVNEALESLDKVISVQERGHQGSLEGAQFVTKALMLSSLPMA
jgi:hypothetical protein